uniref:PDZ domain-containing protein n=1 Tax=Meloidogyne incognita TaxID=6306 RepID=A0A914NAS8_MELIC
MIFCKDSRQSQQQQKEKNNNFSPSPQQQFSPKFSDKKQSSPSSAAIGRHTAVPVLPPSTLLSNGPKPRLCLLIKGSPSQEFGFSLHAEGNGHFIGAVDSDGIAERAGLVTGQRIVGVNGHLVYPNTSHMDIVQIIQREPLRTELLVASEQVDRFYKEYGLAFSYDYVQFYDPVVMRNGNGKPPQLGGAAAVRPKQSPNAVKNQNYEKGKAVQRSRSGSRSVERNPSNKNNGHAIRGRGQSLGKRPPTPSTTYLNGHAIRGRGQSLGKRPPTPSTTYLSSSEQINGHVAVQIEKRSDNMTSIEIGEKHVIADGPVYSTDSSVKPPHPVAAPRTTPRPERRYSPPQPLEIYHPSQLQQYDPSPLSLQSDSTQSRTSLYKSRDSEKSIFALNAKEARQLICYRKKDPRLAEQMSLEEKHRLIMEL